MVQRIGIIGGLGWRSTVDYYSAFHEIVGDLRRGPHIECGAAALEISIESLDLTLALRLLEAARGQEGWEPFDAYHRAALDRLEASGAGLALIASNTPHDRLPQITEGASLKVIDLFEAVAIAAREAHASRILILGTRTTMISTRLRNVLARYGIEGLAPPADVANALEKLILDLQEGRFAGSDRRLLAIVEACGIAQSADCLVGLHCTELPLALPQSRRQVISESAGLSFMNPSMAHVQAALRSAGFVEDGARRD